MGICDIDKLAKLRMRELKDKERQQREAEIDERINKVIDERRKKNREDLWSIDETMDNLKELFAEIKRLKMENANLRAKIESLYFATKEEEVRQNG